VSSVIGALALLIFSGCLSPSDNGTLGSAGASASGAAGTSASGAAGTTGAAGTNATAGTNGAAGVSATAGTNGAAGTGSDERGGTTGSGERGGTTGSAGRGGNTGSAGRGGTTGLGGRGGATGSGGRGGTTGSAGTGASSNFSFFVTSVSALRRLSGSQDGFGGDLRYGETGDGAGLRGADKICATIAETSMPGAGAKQWRAFLSAPAMGSQPQVNAIDRIGNGPWYDRMGRLFSANKANLIGFRPSDANTQIKNDFPNEDGLPNHNPDLTGVVDNHDQLTGSDSNGMLYVSGTRDTTCQGWTYKELTMSHAPRVGHAWPRMACTNGNTCATCGMGMGGTTLGCYGHWMSSLDEGGCAPGVNLQEMGGPMPGVYTVGTGGGYGGFYCFAVTP